MGSEKRGRGEGQSRCESVTSLPSTTEREQVALDFRCRKCSYRYRSRGRRSGGDSGTEGRGLHKAYCMQSEGAAALYSALGFVPLSQAVISKLQPATCWKMATTCELHWTVGNRRDIVSSS